MSKYVVTGWSAKWDGLLYVVEADSLRDAFLRVAEAQGLLFTEVDGQSILFHPDDDVPTPESLEISGYRHCLILHGCELQEGINLDNAVQW